MKFLTGSFFKKYLLPGFVFQSVVIAGGYGTGRELVEYFLNYGPLGGLLGMLLTTAIWLILLVITVHFKLGNLFALVFLICSSFLSLNFSGTPM